MLFVVNYDAVCYVLTVMKIYRSVGHVICRQLPICLNIVTPLPPQGLVPPPPPPAYPDTVSKPVFPHFCVIFCNHPVCSSRENVVCSFVQAAGRVNMGGKVSV